MSLSTICGYITSHRIAFVSSTPNTAAAESIVLRHSLPDAMTAILGIPSKRLHVVHVLCAVSSPKKRNAQNRTGVDDSTEYVRGAGRNPRKQDITHIYRKGLLFWTSLNHDDAGVCVNLKLSLHTFRGFVSISRSLE